MVWVKFWKCSFQNSTFFPGWRNQDSESLYRLWTIALWDIAQPSRGEGETQVPTTPTSDKEGATVRCRSASDLPNRGERHQGHSTPPSQQPNQLEAKLA